MKYSLSILDKNRFGFNTAKVLLEKNDSIDSLFLQCTQDNIEFLIIRVPTDSLNIVQELEKKDAFLADTLVYFQKKEIEKYQVMLPQGYTARLANFNDAADIEALALETFAGYMGHYHADKKLNSVDCDLVYSSWAAASCTNKAVADAVILIECDNEIAAFATLKVNNTLEIEGVLFGVSPNHRKKGLHLNLMQLSENWGKDNNYLEMITSTQINNVIVQKNWIQVDFEPRNSYYTLHKWFIK
jgi:hypothetical protein